VTAKALRVVLTLVSLILAGGASYTRAM